MANSQEAVLGVSTFSSASSKNPVVNGETFNFVATIVGDQAGVLNATVLFNLTGQGVINSTIQGPGACTKITDTTAACNNVDIDPNQTINWVVPVTANANCAPSSISLQTRLVATLVSSTSTTSVNCVASQPSATTSGGTATNPPANTGGSNNGGGSNTTTTTTKTGNGTGSGSGAQATPAAMAGFDIAGFACQKVSGLPLVILLLILWLLASAYYFIFSKR